MGGGGDGGGRAVGGWVSGRRHGEVVVLVCVVGMMGWEVACSCCRVHGVGSAGSAGVGVSSAEARAEEIHC